MTLILPYQKIRNQCFYLAVVVLFLLKHKQRNTTYIENPRLNTSRGFFLDFYWVICSLTLIKEFGMTKQVNKNVPEIVFLKSNRVVLRPVIKDDVPFILKWMNDPNVTQYINAYMPMMEADEDNWFNNLHKRKPNDVVFAIVVEGKIIGIMGIHGISARDRTATTGAFIGEEENWGKGYGSEAKMLLLDYAFNTMNLRKICSGVIAFNERSYKYSLKCGYKEEGRLVKHVYRHGEYWDEILLAIFKEDFPPLWEEFAKKHNIPSFELKQISE